MQYSLSLGENATVAFFNKWHPECAHPGCTNPATTIATAVTPSKEEQRGVTSLCDNHARRQLEFLVQEAGFLPVGNTKGVLVNLREQARMLRDLDVGSVGPEDAATIQDLTGKDPAELSKTTADLVETAERIEDELKDVPRIVAHPVTPGSGAPTPDELRNLLAWAMTHMEGGNDVREQCFQAIQRFDAARNEVEDAPKELECETHGAGAPWRGEVVCSECDRMYLLPYEAADVPQDQLVEPENPPYCDCGKLLTPAPAIPEPERGQFTARPVCSLCYLEHAHPDAKLPMHHAGRGFRAMVKGDLTGNGLPNLEVVCAGKRVNADSLEVEIAPDVSGAILWMKHQNGELTCAFLGPELTPSVVKHVALRSGRLVEH
jgi:hypothetical protein